MYRDDLAAFESFFERHRGPIHRAAFALTGDHQLAEEVLQETFVRAYQHRRTLRTDLSPLPWLHRVALNLCFDALSRRRLPTAAPSPEDLAIHDQSESPAERAERHELRALVREGILAMPEKHRMVLVLFYLDRRSLPEIAELLDVNLGTVKSRLHYALRGLRAHLESDHRFAGAYRGVPAKGEPPR
jgi:RNA polymerase sigma-70 factor (ECF subfamily)